MNPFSNLAAVWQSPIVCNGPDCDYNDLIRLAQIVINNLIVIATVLATIAFVWIGFKLLTSGGNPGAKDEAKKMAGKVLLGFVWILAAWLVVYTITSVLLNDGYSILGRPR
jgi:hypothetical protein